MNHEMADKATGGFPGFEAPVFDHAGRAPFMTERDMGGFHATQLSQLEGPDSFVRGMVIPQTDKRNELS